MRPYGFFAILQSNRLLSDVTIDMLLLLVSLLLF